MRRAKSLLLCASLLGAAAGGPRAVDPPKGDQPAAETDVQFEKFDSLSYNNKTGVAVALGAVVVHDNARISADRIEYSSRKALGTASGHVQFEGERAAVTSDSARVDFRGRRAVFENNVDFVTELPAADGTPAQKTSVACTRLEYFYRQRKGVATGPVRVEQTDQRATGDAAIYDGEAETFAIMGSVKVMNDRGETFDCTKATLSLKDDTIALEGPGTGRFLIEEEAPAG